MRLVLLFCSALILAACGAPADDSAGTATAARGDITLGHPEAYPESVTSLSDGTLIAGSAMGRVFRAGPGETVAETWIEATPENGMQSVLGVLADERSRTLWLCSIPNIFVQPPQQGISKLMAFDLESGALKGAYEFPPNGQGATGVCNDIAVAADGTVFATDTPGGRILTLAPGAHALELYGEDPLLAGIDGVAFAQDGALYVNNVQANTLLRIDAGPNGTMGGLTVLTASQEMDGPDGMRPIGGNRFLLAEGTGGRIGIVAVNGDSARITIIRDGLESSPGVTLIGDTVYAIEGKINYLMDPALRGQDPGPFIAHAIPLPPLE